MKSTLFAILFIVLLPQHVFSQVDPLTMAVKDFLEWQEKHVKKEIAQMSLSALYEERENHAYTKAYSMYKQAMNGGENFFAPYQIANMFNNELNQKFNSDSIVYYTTIAANSGNKMAECDLGIWHSEGFFGVKKDALKALEWYRESASKGWAEAQYNLGLASFFGEGVGSNAEESLKWFMLAADQQHPNAAQNTCVILRNLGKTTDLAKYCQIGASAGNAESQSFLGLYYLNGEYGLMRNRDVGISWLKKSASQGYMKAMQKLAELGL